MSEIDKNLSSILETEYIPSSNVPATIEEKLPMAVDQQQDFDYSRSNYYNLLEKGNDALEGLLEVAKESQHPRAYEVAATMLKNLSDMTDKLMVLQKQKKDLEGGTSAPTHVSVDKAVFVGSTAELLKKVRSDAK